MTPPRKLPVALLVVLVLPLGWLAHTTLTQSLYAFGIDAVNTRDFVRAVRDLSWAASLGDVYAMRALAGYHIVGTFGVVDLAAGEKWLQKCSNAKDASCQELLGLLYWVGSASSRPNYEKAEALLQKAATAGRPEATAWLAAVKMRRPAPAVLGRLSSY